MKLLEFKDDFQNVQNILKHNKIGMKIIKNYIYSCKKLHKKLLSPCLFYWILCDKQATVVSL